MTNSRQKGKRGERDLAKRLQELGFEARRGQQYSGASGDADVVGVPGVHIECKRVEQCRMYDWMRQAERDARPGETPVVMWRKNCEQWLVVMRLEEWVAMQRKGEKNENDKGENHVYRGSVGDFGV